MARAPIGKSWSTAAALLVVGLLPTLIGLAGRDLFRRGFSSRARLSRQRHQTGRCADACGARRLLFASLIYLPALLLVMALDRVPL